MKKYSTPEMDISVFDCESVVTQSSAEKPQAIDKATEIAKNIIDTKHTFTIKIIEFTE